MMDNVIELLRKLKALAERGEDGERVTAQKMLEREMLKHNISYEDIEEEATKEFEIKYGKEFHKLFVQVLASVTNKTVNTIGKFRGQQNRYFFVATPSQAVEVYAKFHFYKNALQKEFEIFYAAFIQVNRLFPDVPYTDEERRNMTPEERERIRKLLRAAQSMEASIYNKQLNK